MAEGVETLRERCLAEMRRRDWSMRQVSIKSGRSENVLARFINKGTKRPEPETIVGLARAFGWDPTEALVLAGYGAGDGAVAVGAPLNYLAEVRRVLEAGDWPADALQSLLTLATLVYQQGQAEREQHERLERVRAAVEKQLHGVTEHTSPQMVAETILGIVESELYPTG